MRPRATGMSFLNPHKEAPLSKNPIPGSPFVPQACNQGDPVKVLFINNEGAGFAAPIDVADGTTIAQLFEQRLPGSSANDYLIRVNRLPSAPDQILVENDRVSITATKIAGADGGLCRR